MTASNDASNDDHRDRLIDRIRTLSGPLEAIATDAGPKLPRFDDIRAVVFDVYGTMLISGSGDIGVNTAEDRAGAFGEAIAAVGGSLHGADADRRGVEAMHRHIHDFHTRRRADGVNYPEVEIRDIWRGVVEEMTGDGRLTGVRADDAPTIERLSIEYECRVNPVWPMPTLHETLAMIRGRDLPLGIVSNAQFFTPLLFDAVAEGSLDALGFSADIGVWSYRMLEGKPSTALYVKLAEALAPRGIEPAQVLYVGNDVRNDVRPAGEVGLRTVLFAGDRRSLRLRDDDKSCAGVTPDAVVTSLDQLAELLG